MATQQEVGDLIYATALQWVPMVGGIAQVQREGVSVVMIGQPPRGLRGIHDPATVVLASVELQSVRVIIVGGRPGIPQGQELFSVATEGKNSQDVANEIVTGVSNYLAQTTS